MMKSQDYSRNAASTCFPEGRNMWNARLGMISEIGELSGFLKKQLFQRKEIDIEQLQLELGDVLWYLWLLCDVNSIVFSNVIDSAIPDTEQVLGQIILNMIDSMTLEDPLDTATGIARSVKAAASILKIEIPDLMEQNINKLSARYAGKKINAT